MKPIADFIADRLSDINKDGLAAVAMTARVDIKTARRAKSGAPISAAHALALIAARGYDPITQKPCQPRRLGTFDHNQLGLALWGRMHQKVLTVRDIASAMKVSTRVVDAIIGGRNVSLANVIKACTYLDIHPFDQCERVKEAEAA